MAVTVMTGTYRRRSDESEVHGREMADTLTAEVVARYCADHYTDSDFYVDYDHDGIIPDTGVDDPRGWALLHVESSYTDLAADLRELADDIDNALPYTGTGTHRATLKRHANNLTDYISQIRVDAEAADAEAAREVSEARTWFYAMAAHAEADVPYDLEAGEVYDRAEAAGQSGWEAVRAAGL
jgi:hypothetical protein